MSDVEHIRNTEYQHESERHQGVGPPYGQSTHYQLDEEFHLIQAVSGSGRFEHFRCPEVKLTEPVVVMQLIGAHLRDYPASAQHVGSVRTPLRQRNVLFGKKH